MDQGRWEEEQGVGEDGRMEEKGMGESRGKKEFPEYNCVFSKTYFTLNYVYMCVGWLGCVHLLVGPRRGLRRLSGLLKMEAQVGVSLPG